mgnify:CR=1 FL=1
MLVFWKLEVRALMLYIVFFDRVFNVVVHLDEAVIISKINSFAVEQLDVPRLDTEISLGTFGANCVAVKDCDRNLGVERVVFCAHHMDSGRIVIHRQVEVELWAKYEV